MKTSTPILLTAMVFLAGLAAGSAEAEGQITVTDVFDNYLVRDGVRIKTSEFLGPHWGLSCFIEGTEETILFDTGAGGAILQANIDSLGIGLGSLGMLVVSHNHPDHLGGFAWVLQHIPVARVFFGMAFSETLAETYVTVDGVRRATPVRVGEPVEICKNVYATGELGGNPPEQSLILETQAGLVVVSGCAHSGIVKIARRAKELIGKDVYMVAGGFHLLEATPDVVEGIIQDLQSLGVKKVAPTHCTGDQAIAMFEAAYGQNFVPMGVGQALHFPADPVAAVFAAPESVVAGKVVNWSARVQVPTQGSGAISGRLRADLSGGGGPGVVDLVAEGEGVYRLDPVRLNIPDTTGQRWIPLLSDESSTQGPYSYIRLVVWPGGDRVLFGDGPGEGWTWRTEGKATLDTAASAVAYQGSRALAVQASGLLKVFCEKTLPQSRIGYDSLGLALYPGEGTAPTALEVGLNAQKRRSLLKMVDWADKRWQRVAISLDSLGLEPGEAVASIAVVANPKSTFYLDEVRLIAAPPPATVVEESYSSILPDGFALNQNYPNPFNSGTAISFALPRYAKVELALYNLAGQRVATLVQGAREAGVYTVRWDGRDEAGRELASGVYLYRLRAGTQEQNRKLLLLR
jgi:7,8-dihydropterin-6-yl-methyl-4-(beta-D-ribofuranosyl)aminobenzene 5'-phosphate synthase